MPIDEIWRHAPFFCNCICRRRVRKPLPRCGAKPADRHTTQPRRRYMSVASPNGRICMFRKLSAEAFGTFWLVFGGCGSALIAAGFPDVGIGFVGVSFAFVLTVLTMAYAVGGISGGHFNPAVSLGLAVAGRFEYRELIPYWIAQLVGGIAAALVLYLICSGKAGWMPGGFASNGYDANSPDGYSML